MPSPSTRLQLPGQPLWAQEKYLQGHIAPTCEDKSHGETEVSTNSMSGGETEVSTDSMSGGETEVSEQQSDAQRRCEEPPFPRLTNH